jgi:ubiquinone/menaquinone biosynthesis C-methylase UbiE
MVGCGNSKLSDQMYKAGYTNIVNIDISPSVIEQMKKEFPEMVWEVMDATKMSYKDGEFDVAIDKGTLDALISGKNYDICTAMLKECMRVLKESGQLIQITYGSP